MLISVDMILDNLKEPTAAIFNDINVFALPILSKHRLLLASL